MVVLHIWATVEEVTLLLADVERVEREVAMAVEGEVVLSAPGPAPTQQ